MVTINEWTPDTTYGPNEVVLMFNKLYVSLVSNKDIIPIPVATYSEMTINNTSINIIASNQDNVLTIARSIYPELSDETLINNHLNTDNVWIAVQ